MSAQTRVRVAVAGCGYWGPNLIRNFADHPESDLVIACDAKPERLASIRRRYPACTCTTDFDEALSHPLVEAVALATPVSSHFRLARRALEAGKHVLVE